MSDQELPTMAKPNNNHMRIVKGFGVSIHFFKGHAMSGIVVDVMEDHH